MTEALSDREAIADQVARYAHYFDSHDAERWVELFTDDGVFEVRLISTGGLFVRIVGAEELRAFAAGSPRVLHTITSLIFDELLADSARTRAAVLGTWTSLDDGSPAVFTHGTYEQHWAKIDGKWRLAHLLFHSHGYSVTTEAPSSLPLSTRA